MSKVEQGRLQAGIAVAAFAVAAVLSFVGFYAPPVGVLSESNLYLVAQFLLVTCSLCGVNSIILLNFYKLKSRKWKGMEEELKGS